MIYSLKGKIIFIDTEWIAIEANNVGYKVFTDTSKVGKSREHTFFIYEYIRENRYDLFGFTSKEDLVLFESLLGVNGVGPKMALSLISSLGRNKLAQALEEGEVKTLTSVSGVGQKVANKIIVELKGKLDKLFMPEEDELLQALESLGYRKSEVSHIYSQIPLELEESSEKLKWVLRNIKKN